MKKAFSAVLVIILILAFSAIACADYGILVTRHPTDGICMAGETVWFTADAQYYSSLDWTFVDPCGTEYSTSEFLCMFPFLTVEGEHTTMLTVRNVSPELNGWAVFCSFHSAVDNAKTNWGFFHVNEYTVPSFAAPAYAASFNY